MPASGTGAQTITFTVDANPGPARTAAIIIAGQTFSVSQSGGCNYSLAPGSHNASAGGGASSLAVNTAAGCEWTSGGVPAWITGVPASWDWADTIINFMVAANPDVGSQREHCHCRANVCRQRNSRGLHFLVDACRS